MKPNCAQENFKNNRKFPIGTIFTVNPKLLIGTTIPVNSKLLEMEKGTDAS